MNDSSRIHSERWHDLQQKRSHLLDRFRTWLWVALITVTGSIALYMWTFVVGNITMFAIADKVDIMGFVQFANSIVYPLADVLFWGGLYMPVVSIVYLARYVHVAHQQRYA